MLRDSRHRRNFGRVTFKTARYMYRCEEHGRIRCAPVLMQSVFSHAAAMALRTYNRLDKRLEHHMSRDFFIVRMETLLQDSKRVTKLIQVAPIWLEFTYPRPDIGRR